ncbi:MAG: hypothetical protein ACSLE0_01865 [Chitinophagaceae bacterium]
MQHDLSDAMAVENNGKYYSFSGKEELENQFPSLIRKKYQGYTSFAGQTVGEIFVGKLHDTKKYIVEILSSVVLINNKKGSFEMTRLPSKAQWSPVFSFFTSDFNQDGTTDILLAGNYYGASPYEGRYDANYGTIILNEKNAGFKIPGSLQTGLILDGEVRDIKMIRIPQGKTVIAVARNNRSIKFFSLPGNIMVRRKE